jgi:hypothetical protein
LLLPNDKEHTMGDNHRQYRTLRNALNRCYPVEPEGRLAGHLNTLAGLVSGIVSSRRTNLPQIAAKVPDGTQVESRIKRFSRWINNKRLDWKTYFLPYVTVLLEGLANSGPLFLVMDGSAIGRGCATLVLSVIYKQRALPLVWLVAQGRKGHFDEASHLWLIDQLQPFLPEGVQVIFLGDGEFDGVDLQHQLNDLGWQYVCRTAKNTVLWQGDHSFSLDEVNLKAGQCLTYDQVGFTLQDYGPVQVILWWEKGYQDPLYLVTNVLQTQQACAWYRKRFRIETFFSDQKSRGFHLHKSHLSDPERLTRLMMAACLAYIWILYLGCLAIAEGWSGLIHRSNRCDWSLFQLGLNLLDFFLNEADDVPVAFQMIPFDHEECVR